LADDDKLGVLDRIVEQLAKLLNSLGLNGTRLLWKWNRRRRGLAEAGLKTEILWRSAKGKHKMCPSCRALVDRSARVCPDCGTTLSGVRAPGIGRTVSNLLPGVSAATSVLMLVNGFWFLLMIMAQIKSGSSGGPVSPFSPFDLELMVRFGAGISRERVLSTGMVTGGEWWRLITPMFLHGGMMHFLFNSYLLLNLGPLVEEIYGTPRYWVIYLTCGIAGNMASELPRYVITVGASGAIMGLIGLLLVHGFRSGGVLGQTMKSLLFRLIIYSVILSLIFNIDHLNHIGGLACGALLALIVPHGSYRDRSETVFWQVLSLIGVLLVLIAFGHVAALGRAAAGA
jgi:rhomboid protease GluP